MKWSTKVTSRAKLKVQLLGLLPRLVEHDCKHRLIVSSEDVRITDLLSVIQFVSSCACTELRMYASRTSVAVHFQLAMEETIPEAFDSQLCMKLLDLEQRTYLWRVDTRRRLLRA